MVRDFERGRLTRRQLAASLAVLVTGAQAAPKPSSLRAAGVSLITLPYVSPTFNVRPRFTRSSLGCPQAAFSNNAYLGCRQELLWNRTEGKHCGPDHYDFGIAGFNADDVTAKLKERNFETGARRVEGVVQVPGPRRIRCSSEFTRL